MNEESTQEPKLKPKFSSKRLMFIIARVTLLVYFALTLFVLFFEDSMIYFPTSIAEETSFHTYFNKNIAVEEVNLTTEDAVRVNGVWVSKKEEQATYTVLVCHGNAGNLTHRIDFMRFLMRVGLDVFLFDYRGYGKSEGTPSEEGLYRDADAAYAYLTQERHIAPERIIIMGVSLGGAIAIDLAARKPCAGLIVQSSFAHASDMASRVLPFYPASWIMHSEFNSVRKVTEISCPKLFVHGDADEIIPFEQGQKLFDAAVGPKTFVVIPGAQHNTTYIKGRKLYASALRLFIDTLKAKNP